ncbi:MAG: hypothetical protein GXO87_13775 [Chlorobi bacterium]|nr:hypothetical protein [Chlorobiota bacterium]
MSKIAKVILMMILTAVTISSQQIGSWENFTDMKEVTAVVKIDGGSWAATTGGVFFYDEIDSSFKRITKSEGLKSQILNTISIDNEMKIWVGATNGAINIYNPKNGELSVVLDILNSDKTKKKINGLFSYGDSIYVASDFGISVIQSKSFSFDDTYIKFGDFPSETIVKNIFKDKLLFACTEAGVAVQKPGTTNLLAPESWRTYFLDEDVPVQSVNKIVKFGDEILLATNAGIYSFVQDEWIVKYFQNSDILDMKVVNGYLYALSRHTLYGFDGSESSNLFSNTAVVFNSVDAEGGKVVVGSDEGIFIGSDNDFVQLFPDGPEANRFNGLSVDQEGKLWSGSGKDNLGKGVYMYDGDKWTNFNKETDPVFPFNDFIKTFAGNNGKVYFCSWGRGFIEYDHGKMINYKSDNSPLNGIRGAPEFIVIPSVQTDSKKNAWILNYWSDPAEPLSALTPDSVWYSYSFSNPIITNSDLQETMVIDQYDTKWFTVANKGLYFFNENGTFEDESDDDYGRLTTGDGLTTGSITALAVDKRGELWIGKNPGINILVSPSQPYSSQIIDVRAFRSQLITAIAVDAINRKWVGTKDDGVFVVTPEGSEVIAHYNSKNSPIPFDDIKSIAIDEKNGLVYIGTDFGISAVKTSSVAAQESFNEMFVYPQPFLIGDGEKQLTIEGLVKDSEVNIYTINGVLIRKLVAGTNDSPGGNLAFWNGRDEGGQFVNSGVYLIVAFDRDATNVGKSKVAVIRK